MVSFIQCRLQRQTSLMPLPWLALKKKLAFSLWAPSGPTHCSTAPFSPFRSWGQIFWRKLRKLRKPWCFMCFTEMIKGCTVTYCNSSLHPILVPHSRRMVPIHLIPAFQNLACPKWRQLQMLSNVAVDSVVGSSTDLTVYTQGFRISLYKDHLFWMVNRINIIEVSKAMLKLAKSRKQGQLTQGSWKPASSKVKKSDSPTVLSRTSGEEV